MTIILEQMEQGSEEWLNARIGCVTMSRAKDLLSKGQGNNPSKTKETYILSVASELLTGTPAAKINAWDMARGTLLEPYALSAYKAATGEDVRTVGLGYLDDNKRIAASPDALGRIKGVEIKCQAPKNHLETIIGQENPKQFEAQMQGGMWIFDMGEWDYVSFCPEFKEKPLVIIPMKRNEEMIKQIEIESHLAVEKVDEYVRLASQGDFGDKLAAICEEALEMIDIVQNKEVEIY